MALVCELIKILINQQTALANSLPLCRTQGGDLHRTFWERVNYLD